MEETPKSHHDSNYNPLTHDALHCAYCDNEARILQAVVILNSNIQTLLRKFEEAEGTPHGRPFNFSQASPAQNTGYQSPAVPYMGVVRSLLISGNGNVTLTMNDEHNAIAGGLVVCTIPCNGAAVSIPHRFNVPLGATFSLSTDSSSGTGLLALSAWIEPVAMSSAEFFRFRK